MVGAKIKGFDVMVKLTDKAKIMIFEGDEYLSSPIDKRPKFHLYKPHIALINGIAWDHINVFPVYKNYVEQFKIFADLICKNGSLIFFNDDKEIKNIAENVRADIKTVSAQNNEQAPAIRSQMTDMQPILAALAQRLLSQDGLPQTTTRFIRILI